MIDNQWFIIIFEMTTLFQYVFQSPWFVSSRTTFNELKH
jgi:hypothetical protein